MNGLDRLGAPMGARRVVAAVLVGLGLVTALPASAGPLTGSLDQFVIFKNGNLFASDTFSDGIVPPSGEGNLGTGTTPMTYFTQGNFTETGGRVLMDSENTGLPIFRSLVNANTGATIFASDELLRVHTGRAQTNTQPFPNTSGLKADDLIQVYALYDLQGPPQRGDNFGIGLVDNTANTGPTSDRMRLSVVRSSQTGNLRVGFWRNNQTTDPDQNEIFGSDPLNLAHSQIVLRLSRDNTANNLITASYAYIDGPNVGLDISNQANLAGLTFNTIATNNPNINPSGFTPTIFNNFDWTRAEFRQLARDADNRFDFARLTTGSPVSISQTVDTTVAAGVTEAFVTFNYRFETTFGTLTVTLDDVVLGTFFAPGALNDDFLSASLIFGGTLLNGQKELKFTLDGNPGAKILLDSIAIQGLANGSTVQNGNFATGGLDGWLVTTQDAQASAGVLTIVAAPEPASALVLGLGLAGLGALRRRRSARAAA